MAPRHPLCRSSLEEGSRTESPHFAASLVRYVCLSFRWGICIRFDLVRVGAGVYFAENSSKSDEYIEADENSNCYIILSRVLLGTPHVTLKSMSGTRLPPILPSDPSRRSDSILGECARSKCFEARSSSATASSSCTIAATATPSHLPARQPRKPLR